jgi:hypothetical protein
VVSVYHIVRYHWLEVTRKLGVQLKISSFSLQKSRLRALLLFYEKKGVGGYPWSVLLRTWVKPAAGAQNSPFGDRFAH